MKTEKRNNRSNKSQNQHSHNDDENLKKTLDANNKGLNTTLLIAAGFVVIIFYTIWSSVRTYSDQMHYDME